MSRKITIRAFELRPGEVLVNKYKVCELLGRGWEGEVYRVKELRTGIDRAAKLFFPQRNAGQKISAWYAKKLYKLRHCPMVIQYHTQETFEYEGVAVALLVSEYVEGQLLSQFLDSVGGRLTEFQALHLLYRLALGVESIHHMREFHGDLHADNIIVCRYGLGFELKFLDMYNWTSPRAENIRDDVYNLVRLFYSSMGGAAYYRDSSSAVKSIVCGLNRKKVFAKFRTAGHLREHIEMLSLSDG